MAKAIINGQEIFGNVHMGEGGDVANSNIADVYDPTQTYNTGDRRIYDDVLYVCNDDNVTGAWDSTKWDSATIDEIISALTADDIPYSQGVSVADKLDNVPTFDTLTTSDNNKLLGVSVSGDDISVGAVGVETSSLTVATGVSITISRSKTWKQGKLAFITFAITVNANINGDTTIMNTTSGYSADSTYDLLGVDNNGGSKPFYIVGTNIRPNGNLVNGNRYFVTASYLTN